MAYCPNRASSAGWSWLRPCELDSRGRLEACTPSCRGCVRMEAVYAGSLPASFPMSAGPEEETSAIAVECFCSSYAFIDPAPGKEASCLPGPSCGVPRGSSPRGSARGWCSLVWPVPGWEAWAAWSFSESLGWRAVDALARGGAAVGVIIEST